MWTRKVINVVGPSALVLTGCLAGVALATPVTVTVQDAGGVLVDAVVSLETARPVPATGTSKTVSMDQVNSQFVPAVLAVRTGSLVRFPNNDQIRHQVYSFSPAKKFELPLFQGSTAAPVRFDQAGLVTVGCNIHDWMLGYIVVLDTRISARAAAMAVSRSMRPRAATPCASGIRASRALRCPSHWC